MGDGRLVLLLQLPLSLAVVPEVALRADQEDGNAGTMVRNLRVINKKKTVNNYKLYTLGFSSFLQRIQDVRSADYFVFVGVEKGKLPFSCLHLEIGNQIH